MVRRRLARPIAGESRKKQKGKKGMAYRGCLDRFWDDGQVVESFFHEQPDDSVRIEEEVAARSSFVPDDRVQRLELSCMG